MRNFMHPAPAPPGFGGKDVVPEARASLLSKLVMQWLSPLLNVGFTRPLEKDDLWQLPAQKLTHALSARVEASFYARVPPAERPAHLRGPGTSAAAGEAADGQDGDGDEKDPESAAETAAIGPADTHAPRAPTHDRSLLRALHASFFRRIWACGLAKLASDTLSTTTPLVNRLLLAWLAEVYVYHRLPEADRAQWPGKPPRGVGYGIGIAFAIFAMQECASLIRNQYTFTSSATGLMVRSSVIGAIFRKSLRLSGRARVHHSVGQITTMISTDATHLDACCVYFHDIWSAPIQMIIGIALLIYILGYSALVGLGVLILGLPIQSVLVTIIYKQRNKGVKVTDQRVRLLNEVLQGIRLIKYFAWEDFYAHKIASLRGRELQAVRKISMALAVMVGSMTFIPTLAAILSFVTYALSGHALDVPTIFTAFQFFEIIRQPLTVFPFVLVSLAEARVAAARIAAFLGAEERQAPHAVDRASASAVAIDAEFAWEAAANAEGKAEEEKKPAPPSRRQFGRKAKRSEEPVLPTAQPEGEAAGETAQRPFELKDVRLTVRKGDFVAIIGRIGSGKSSLLQSITGELRRTRGNVVLGGSVAYVPQTSWILNASVRQNILFGAEDQEQKFRDVVDACALQHDLDMLPHGEATEIGERGINLSGGQKARVSLARSAYSDADIVLLDDVLSAVDSHTAKSIIEKCFLGYMASKTRILATHNLSVLDKVDYIFVVDNGTIVERGTYSDLRSNSALFSRIIDEHGAIEEQKENKKEEVDEGAHENGAAKDADATIEKKQEALMQEEERAMGAVSLQTYIKYSRFAGGLSWAIPLIVLLLLSQCANVGVTLFLSFWTEDTFGLTQNEYMAIYAALGVAEAILWSLLFFAVSLMTLAAGFKMFRGALGGVTHSPVRWFDTTPLGRIISRLSKDQDTVDQELAMSLFQLSTSVMTVVGTIALVFYAFPLLGLIFVPLAFFYWVAAIFYRRTSIETKRLDSLMRSAMYASYTEALTGISSIRAYGEQDRFISAADGGLDMENRAYYMTVAIQGWLAIRLDMLGNTLVLGIGLFSAGYTLLVSPTNAGVPPAKTAVVITYTLAMTQVLSQMVRSYAQNEQNMNAVERILTYTELEPEGELRTSDDPPQSWPAAGAISFQDVQLAYRPELPLVLKGVSFDVKAGEKVGIVGRTGAGKSSLLQGLFRVVELHGGRIDIDGVNIRQVGLTSLRERVAFVPQDSTLFLGSLRENLDPTGTRTDAELLSALQRAWLLPRDETQDPVAQAKFGLDALVDDEGVNYSAGEKQLLALCRALVKNSRIIILDEATSNVDVETDAKLQKTIQTEFADRTLLCIAHRLNTIAYYDRILVLDAGNVAEFDTPLNLFDRDGGIFRSLCEEAGLSRSDIVRIRESVQR